jgi:hypothetical protein
VRELGRIAQQIPEYLAQPIGIAEHLDLRQFTDLQLLRLAPDLRSAGLHSLGDDDVDPARIASQVQLPCDDPIHVHQVFDQTCLQLQVPTNDTDLVSMS